MQYQVRGIPAVKAFVNGRVVDEFVGAQPEPMVRQFIDRVLAQNPTGPAAEPKEQTIPASSSERLQKAEQALKQGQGCTAVPLLQNFPPDPHQAKAQQLLPLAQLMCDGAQGKLNGNESKRGQRPKPQRLQHSDVHFTDQHQSREKRPCSSSDARCVCPPRR